MMAVGFFMFFLSPDATREGVKWPRWYILLGAGAAIAVISLPIGYTLSGSDTTAMSDLLKTMRGKLSEFVTVRRT